MPIFWGAGGILGGGGFFVPLLELLSRTVRSVEENHTRNEAEYRSC